MHDYLPLLAKLPIVIAALVWAVRELILLRRDDQDDGERSEDSKTGDQTA